MTVDASIGKGTDWTSGQHISIIIQIGSSEQRGVFEDFPHSDFYSTIFSSTQVKKIELVADDRQTHIIQPFPRTDISSFHSTTMCSENRFFLLFFFFFLNSIKLFAAKLGPSMPQTTADLFFEIHFRSTDSIWDQIRLFILTGCALANVNVSNRLATHVNVAKRSVFPSAMYTIWWRTVSTYRALVTGAGCGYVGLWAGYRSIKNFQIIFPGSNI